MPQWYFGLLINRNLALFNTLGLVVWNLQLVLSRRKPRSFPVASFLLFCSYFYVFPLFLIWLFTFLEMSEWHMVDWLQGLLLIFSGFNCKANIH